MTLVRRFVAVLAVGWAAACSSGSDAAPDTSSVASIAERFDEDAVVAAATELAGQATTRGLTPRYADLSFDGCGDNEADEQVGGDRPKYRYRLTVGADAPIGPSTVPTDVDRVGSDVAEASGWSAADRIGRRQRGELSMRYRTWGPRLVIEVSGPCREVVDEDAANAHAIGPGSRTVVVPGLVELTDRPLAMPDGTYLPAIDAEIRAPGG